jgi:hypothetical protein
MVIVLHIQEHPNTLLAEELMGIVVALDRPHAWNSIVMSSRDGLSQ